MLCPFCGEDINHLRALEKNHIIVEWEIRSDGEMEEVDRDIESSEVLSYSFPCCGSVLEVDTMLLAEDLLKGKAIIIPAENSPEPVKIGEGQVILIKYRDELYIGKERIYGDDSWSFSYDIEFILCYKFDYYTQIYRGVDNSRIARKKLEKLATEITDKAFLLPKRGEEE